MAKFNAATAVETLEYDFTAYGGGSGIIPEPTTGQVDEFFDAIKAMAKEVKALSKSMKDVDIEDDDDASEIIAGMGDDVIGQYQERMIEAVAGLCSGVPSAADIARLPYRVLSAFTAWIGSALRPEAQRPATTR